MSKKNKRRNHNYKAPTPKHSTRPEPAPVKPLAGETILARFNTLKREKGDALTPDDIIGFISMENAKSIGLAGMGQEDDWLLKECGEFLLSFMDEYGRNNKVMLAIEDNWGEAGPRIFRMGAYALENSKEFPRGDNVPLTEKQAAMRDQLVDYIFDQNTCRTVTFLVNNPDGGFANQQLQFPEDISKKDMPSAREVAGDWIGYTLMFSGAIILRLHDIGRNGKDILNGFTVTEDAIIPLPAQQLQEAQETMPDGTRRPDKTVEYRLPGIIFKIN